MGVDGGVNLLKHLPRGRSFNPNVDEGINFATNQMVDMFQAGIVDRCKVTKTALRSAASVASTLLTTNYAIVEA